MRILVCLFLLAVLGAQSADAQRRRGRDRDHPGWWERRGPVEFGVRTGHDFAEEVGSAGAQLRLPLIRQLHLVPSGDVFLGDAVVEWQVNADAALRPDALGGIYFGAGAAFAHGDFDSDGDEGVEIGYNLLLGMDGAGRLLGAAVRPFVEGRWTEVEDLDPFRLAVGINVPVR